MIALFVAGELNAAEFPLEEGLYVVHFRLELPHLETFAVDRKAMVCIDHKSFWQSAPPIPLLSQNNIFSGCQIKNIWQTKKKSFGYDIECGGRGAAKARAVYVPAIDAFRGRISIMQGAKNMTMAEIQRGRRLGHCG